MKPKHVKEIFQLSHKRKDNFVTPLFLKWYFLEQFFTAEEIIKILTETQETK